MGIPRFQIQLHGRVPSKKLNSNKSLLAPAGSLFVSTSVSGSHDGGMITDESCSEIGEHAVLKASCGLNIDRLPFTILPHSFGSAGTGSPGLQFLEFDGEKSERRFYIVANFIERQRRRAVTWQNTICRNK